MERASVAAIVEALNRAGARYLLVGGLAVAAHGVLRFTADVDLVLDPDPAASGRAIAALKRLGYRPRAPVAFEEFADSSARERWSREKGMTVFSVWSSEHPATEIDLFLEAPFDFDRCHASARKFEVEPGLEATFVGRSELIDMKRKAGRPHDIQDASDLERLAAEEGEIS